MIRDAIWLTFDRACELIVRPRPSSHRVLIIRTDAIGDFVLWADAARALKTLYEGRGYTVVLLANASWADWAADLGVAHEVWAIAPQRFVRSLAYRGRWLARLRKARFSVVILPNANREALVAEALVHATGAAERIAPLTERPEKRKNVFTRLIEIAPQFSMELQRNAEFVRKIGVPQYRARVADLRSSAHDRPTDKTYVVLFPGASWPGKAWPAEKYIQIGQLLCDYGFQIVLAGGAGDMDRSRYIADRLEGAIRDLTGKTSLQELSETLENAALIITNDTSALHIGSAVRTQVVCIMGGGHFGRFGPYQVETDEDSAVLPVIVSQNLECFGCDWHCRYAVEEGTAVPCVRDVAVEAVWARVEIALGLRFTLSDQ